jgi:hypothetical protein
MDAITPTTKIDWVRINRYCEITGETPAQTRHKRDKWWIEGIHYRKGADRKWWYHLANINQWLATATPEQPHG